MKIFDFLITTLAIVILGLGGLYFAMLIVFGLMSIGDGMSIVEDHEQSKQCFKTKEDIAFYKVQKEFLIKIDPDYEVLLNNKSEILHSRNSYKTGNNRFDLGKGSYVTVDTVYVDKNSVAGNSYYFKINELKENGLKNLIYSYGFNEFLPDDFEPIPCEVR